MSAVAEKTDHEVFENGEMFFLLLLLIPLTFLLLLAIVMTQIDEGKTVENPQSTFYVKTVDHRTIPCIETERGLSCDWDQP